MPVSSNPPTPASLRPLRILLAEDNKINRMLAVRLLEKRGHTVVTAENGRAALAALDQAHFDVVLMDVQMPEMTGFEAAAAIREKERTTGRHIPIIAMTAHAMVGDRERCLTAGMDGYISKPVEPRALTQALERVIADTPAASAAADERPPAGERLDRAELLARVDGDMDLLQGIAALFLKRYPEMLSEIRNAIAQGDGKALERAAHSFKGAVGNFSVSSPFEAAKRLELMGREGDLRGAEDMLIALEQEMARLEPELAALAEEVC